MHITQKNTIQQIQNALMHHRLLLVYGMPGSGKTKVAEHLEASFAATLYTSCRDWAWRELLTQKNIREMEYRILPFQYILLDDAQALGNMESMLLWLKYQFPNHVFIAFSQRSPETDELADECVYLPIYPWSLVEYNTQYHSDEIKNRLPNILRYGMMAAEEKDPENYLNHYFSKQIIPLLEKLAGPKQPQIPLQVLRLLAIHPGKELSDRYLTDALHVHISTIQNALKNLEKAGLIFSVKTLSGKADYEVKETKKYYFTDLGLRNYLIQNFIAFEYRTDIDILWENFCISERRKVLAFKADPVIAYYWRTYDGKSVQWIEKIGDEIIPYHFVYSLRKKIKPASVFMEAYQAQPMRVIHAGNFI